MKKRSTETPARKAYASPKLVVFGKVSELTQGGRGRRRRKGKKARRNGGGGGGHGHGGARS